MELLSVTMNEGVKRRSEIEGKDNSSEDKSNYKIVHIGDIVYNSMRMWQGASGISQYYGIVSPAYTVLKPKMPIANEFFAALFKTRKLVQTFQKNSQGLTSDTWNLKYPQIAPIKISVPSLQEQTKIAKMLTLFDLRIKQQERLISFFKSYKKGYLIGWSAVVLKAVLKHCTKEEYSLLYRANPNIGFSINQLIAVDKGLLNAEHKKQVEDYYTNLNSMKATIKDITGDITVSGLRENVKKLTSDEKTKRFSKLCNNLIGHVSKGLETAGWAETEQWLKDALELKELAVDMRRRLALKNPE